MIFFRILLYFGNYHENSNSMLLAVLMSNFLCCMDHKNMKIVDFDPFQAQIFQFRPFFGTSGGQK